MKTKNKKTTAQNLESRFDAGEDVLDYFNRDKSFRPGHVKKRVNLDIPIWMIQRIDRQAGRNGIARQAQIKSWLADRIKTEAL